MPKDFLNNQLVTVKGFGPREASNEPEDLEKILDKEDQKTRTVVRRRDVAETGRRREEVQRDLDEIVSSLDTEQQLVKEKLTRFSSLQAMLANLPEDVSQDRLMEVKQAIREAHMEMVKHHRENLSREEQAGENLDWTSLTCGQLTKIGLGLAWPLILGLLAAAGIVALALHSVFGV